jgi:hypothetical protein
MPQNPAENRPPDDADPPEDSLNARIPPIDFDIVNDEPSDLPSDLIPVDPPLSGAAAPSLPPPKPSSAPPPQQRPAATGKPGPSQPRGARRTAPPRQRPSVPQVSSPGESPPPAPFVHEDDDIVPVPAPSMQALVSLAANDAARTRILARSIFFRRTIIPVLLTVGLMLPILSLLWLGTGLDSPLRRIGAWLPITLAILGAVLLVLAVLNMAQVKHAIEESRRTPPR